MNLDTINFNNYTCAFHTVSKCILWKGSSGHGKKYLIWFQFWLISEAHAALWPAMLGVWKLFHDMEAEMFSVPLAERGDRDRWALWLKRPPGCIHPNGSEPHSPLSLPSDKALPIETLSCKVRGHTNSPTPSYFLYAIPSISVHQTLWHFFFSLKHPPSVTLWPIDLTGGEIISWSSLPLLSGPYMYCSSSLY